MSAGAPGWGSAGALSRALQAVVPQKCSEPQTATWVFFFYYSSGNFAATCRELMPFSVVLKSIPRSGLQPSQVMDLAEKLSN